MKEQPHSDDVTTMQFQCINNAVEPNGSQWRTYLPQFDFHWAVDYRKPIETWIWALTYFLYPNINVMFLKGIAIWIK